MIVYSWTNSWQFASYGTKLYECCEISVFGKQLKTNNMQSMALMCMSDLPGSAILGESSSSSPSLASFSFTPLLAVSGV